MKKWWLVLLLCLMLTGCKQRAFETMSDVYEQPAGLEAREVLLMLPQEAMAMDPQEGEFYLCEGFSLSVQTFSSGDLNRTIRAVTGFDRESLSVMELRQDDIKRYEWVWASAGEGGECLNRAVLLDDGVFQYVLTLQGSAEMAGELKDTWQEIVGSFSLDTGP